MNSIRKPEEFKFAIFGRIFYTDHLIKELNSRGFPRPIVITSLDEEYIRDKRILTQFGLYGNLERLVERGLAKLYKYENINDIEVLNILKENHCNIALSTSCRNIIKKDIIKYFQNNIFNIHDSFLPDERGGALNTWRILNGIDSVGDTIHYLDEGIDSGNIVLQKKVLINKKRPKPVDYLIAEKENCHNLLSEFLDILINYSEVPSVKQDNNLSFYYPRLFTEINGAINWNWDISSVERFIRGFSNPYPGAYTYYRGKKINIIDAFIDDSIDKDFHPFSNGKIVTIMDNNCVRVIAGRRAMILTEISVDGESMKPGKYLTLRFTLTSKRKELDHAKTYVPTTKAMNEQETNK